MLYKTFTILVTLFIVGLATLTLTAANPPRDITYEQVRVYSVPENTKGALLKDVQTIIRLDNGFNKDLHEVSIMVSIPELGVRAPIQRFSLDKTDEINRQLTLELGDVPPGEYYVRITTTADQGRRVKHRMILIE